MTHINQGLIRVNGDIENNIFVFANSLATIANGGAGNDYYFYLSGQVTISDYSSNNRLYFGANITITSANISRSQLYIDFEGTDDTLRLRNFSSYQFFIGSDEDRDNDEDGLSHTEFLTSVNSGNITVSTPSELSPTAPTLERTVEIRANGTIDADTFSLGYDLRAELNGGAGRDTFVITPYQTDDVQIRDFSVGNLIRFESDVEISDFSIDRGTFNISLNLDDDPTNSEDDAIISVIIGSLQHYQLGEGSIMNAAGFTAALAPTSITLADQVTTLAEDSDAIRVATINIVNADGSSSLRGGLELSGDDSALFEVSEARTELLLRADAPLDFETNGSLSVTVSSTLNSGTTATLEIMLTDANDAPTNSVTADRVFEVAEGGSYTLTTDDLSATDEDASDGAEQLTWRVSTAPTSGTLQIGVAMVDSFTQAQLVAGAVIYVHNGNEPVAENFTLQVEDDGTPPLTADSQTITVTVTPVNDAPTNSVTADRAFDVAEGGSYTLTTDDLSATDEDASDGAEQLTWQVSTAPISGTLQIGGAMVSKFTQAQLEAGAVVYVRNDNDEVGMDAGTDSFTVQVEDDETLPLTAESQTITVTVTPVDDDPIISTIIPSQVIADDEPTLIDLADFFSDPEGDSLRYTAVSGDTDFVTATIADDGSSTLTLTPVDTNDTPVTITVTASDEAGQPATQAFRVVVSSDTIVPAIQASAIHNDGFLLNGVNRGDESGRSVSGAGDVNGDGLDDIIIGAFGVNGTDGYNSGASYLVFGNSDGGIVELDDIDDDTDTRGFVLNGVNENDLSGISVSGAGDVNGDGLDDIIIGANRANSNDSGASYVVFGKTDGNAVALSEIAGNNGFVLNGVNANDQSGFSVSGTGDVNGDGLDDIIVGTPFAAPNGSLSGASYVVFGKANGDAVELSEIGGSDNAGFVLNGVNVNDRSGISVSGAGDVNGDGLDDLIIGARGVNGNRGTSYVVFGKADGNAVELSDIADNAGFVINGVDGGDYSGNSVSGAGDVNGDGLDDIIIGAYGVDGTGANDSGASYVVFGKANGDAVELGEIGGSDNDGFVINGVDENDQSGRSVSGAGDINGDGLDDIIVGANQADPNGNDSGASYLVFGKTDGNAVELSLVEEFGIGGFVINGADMYNRSGYSVSGAGDVNGDGFDDLIVGASRADPNSVADSGASYVIFGGQGVSDSAIVYDGSSNTLTGNGMANQIIGGAGDDTLIGNGGADILRGGAGDDVLAISDADFAVIDGGLGIDTLRLDSMMTLNLRDIPNNHLDSIEIIDLNGMGSTLVLAIDDILSIVGSGARNTLRIDGDSTDNLDISQTGFFDSRLTETGTNYQIYLPDPLLGLNNSVTLLVDTAVTVQGDITRIADIELSANDQGFVINGASAGDQIGGSVSTAGDFNGDGFADLLIASAGNNDTGNTVAVVFGGTSGSDVELSMLGSNGFSIEGLVAESSSMNQFSVSGAGDVNGDGLDDIIIGARLTDPSSGSNSGASYVVFGSTDSGSIALSDIIAGNNGFVLNGANAGDYSGRSVSGAGDVNGDGLDDIIIGASGANSSSGASYVVFGKSDGNAVELSDIADGAGFVLNGATMDDQSGISVSGAGDVNGDGLDDIIIGASGANDNREASYVVFGKADGSAVELSDIATDNNGFVLNGVTMDDQSGFSVSSAGDVNGDGLDDILIGASGANYVVFGKADGDAIELSDIAADDGFVINGVDENDQSGISVSGAGDINGDGLDDILIGANQADPNGGESGVSYLVFGKRDDDDVQLNSIVLGIGGFVINGASASDQSGASVSGAGDVDGDGFDDLLVGASGVNGSRGASYVIFGGVGVSDSAMVYDGTTNTLTGDEMANQLIGGAGNDTLIGNGGADVLRGGAGDDVLAISDTDFSVIDGGLGIDTLRLDSMMTLNLRDIPNNRLDSIEVIDLNGMGSTLILATDDILNIVGRGNTLQIDGDSTDTLNAIQALFFDSEETRDIGGTAYRIYQADASLGLDDSVRLLVDPDVRVEEGVATIEASAIHDGGFVLNGVSMGDLSGYSVSGAGDINGDGLDDIIIGARDADSNGADSGASYVVFGKTDGGGDIVELSTIATDGAGFVLNGVDGGDRSGFSVSGAGDVNGDGLDDIIIGASRAEIRISSGTNAGYVVFGKSDSEVIELSDIDNNENDAGFFIRTRTNFYSTDDPISVSRAGDVNGDGLDDIILGKPYADPNATNPSMRNNGASYVVFGKTDGSVATLAEIDDGDNDEGFAINGGFITNGSSHELSGWSVSDAGDVNGDGLDDVIIGAPNVHGDRTHSGASYVVFGKTDGGVIELSDIANASSEQGFAIEGGPLTGVVNNRGRGSVNILSGASVSGAGDVNGDGLDDVIIGAYYHYDDRTGASYVVFGKTNNDMVELSAIADDDDGAGLSSRA